MTFRSYELFTTEGYEICFGIGMEFLGQGTIPLRDGDGSGTMGTR